MTDEEGMKTRDKMPILLSTEDGEPISVIDVAGIKNIPVANQG